MDTRKFGIKSLTKAGCYYILFGAIWCAVFGVISLFVKFDNIVRHDLLTSIFFILSIVLFACYYVAIRSFEDPSKMILEFHPPKPQHRSEIQNICKNIYKAYNKNYKLLYVLLIPILIGGVCFMVCYSILPLSYFIANAGKLITNSFLFPAVFTGLFAFFTWGIIYRNRLEEIQDGAYAVCELHLVDKYYCIHPGKTSASTRTEYLVILADSYGNKGRFKVCENEYYRFHTDNTILLVKRSKGKLFYNAMEPVAILEPYQFSPDM